MSSGTTKSRGVRHRSSLSAEERTAAQYEYEEDAALRGMQKAAKAKREGRKLGFNKALLALLALLFMR